MQPSLQHGGQNGRPTWGSERGSVVHGSRELKQTFHDFSAAEVYIDSGPEASFLSFLPETCMFYHVLYKRLPGATGAFPIKEYAHAVCYQQMHSLHMTMLLDPHNTQHLPKLEKCFPHCPHLYFDHKIITGHAELSMRVMWLLYMFYRIGSLGIVRDERGSVAFCLRT